MEKLLPVGSVLYLQEGSTPLVIIGVAQLVKRSEDEISTYYDYSGSIYPQGATEEEIFYFHQENISEVLFMGYESEQHDRYLQAIAEWKEKNKDSFEVGKIEQSQPIS